MRFRIGLTLEERRIFADNKLSISRFEKERIKTGKSMASIFRKMLNEKLAKAIS